MICYIMRHGKYVDSVRGGWSDVELTEQDKSKVELIGKISYEI